MDEQAAFLRSICENPADDAPRLIFADWLEERVGDVECSGCVGWSRVKHEPHPKCTICSGTGCISNGFAERAEFIRVQVELARLSNPMSLVAPSKEYNQKWIDLNHRERELLHSHKTEFMGSLSDIKQTGQVDVEIIRGFPATLVCNTTDFLANTEKLFTMPLEKVTFSDTTIHASGGNATYYVGGLDKYPRDWWKWLDSKSHLQLRNVLSTLAVTYGRVAVGLPPLPNPQQLEKST